MSSMTRVILILSNIILVLGKILPIAQPSALYVALEVFLGEHIKESATNLLIRDDHNDLVASLDHISIFRTNSTSLREILDALGDKPQTYTIFISSFHNFDEMINTNLDKLSRRATYFVILEKNMSAHIMAEALWKSGLPFSYIILLDVDNYNAKIYTLHIKECGSIGTARYVTTISGNRSIDYIPSWDMKSELRFCPLYVIWAGMPPFVNDANIPMPGIFVEVVKALGHFTDRKVQFRPTNPSYLEEISEAYNFASVMEDLDGEYASIFVGPTDIHVSTIFDISPILAVNSLLLLTPKPIVSLWKSMMSLEILGAITGYSLFYFFVVLIFCLVAKSTEDRHLFSSKTRTYFQFIGLLFSIPTLHRLPKNRKLQIFLGTFLLQATVFSIFIQGNLVSSLSGTLYGKPIESIEQLLESNLPIKVVNGISFLFRVGRNSKDIQVFERLQDLEAVLYPFQAGNMAVRSRDFATVIDTGYLIMRPNILKSFSVFEIYDVKETIAMPKNAYFAEKYTEYFTTIIEIGVISKFNKLYEHFYALKQFVEEDKRNFIVSFDQIRPVLFMVVTGYVLAFTSFVFEMSIANCKLFQRIFKFNG